MYQIENVISTDKRQFHGQNAMKNAEICEWIEEKCSIWRTKANNMWKKKHRK